MKKNDIVHQYFKKVIDQGKILVQIDPSSLAGLELLIHPNGDIVKTKRDFDEDIYDDLKEDEFEEANSMEFNLYLKGLVK